MTEKTLVEIVGMENKQTGMDTHKIIQLYMGNSPILVLNDKSEKYYKQTLARFLDTHGIEYDLEISPIDAKQILKQRNKKKNQFKKNEQTGFFNNFILNLINKFAQPEEIESPSLEYIRNKIPPLVGRGYSVVGFGGIFFNYDEKRFGLVDHMSMDYQLGLDNKHSALTTQTLLDLGWKTDSETLKYIAKIEERKN